ncbi:putative SAM-dependent methyltransferase [Bradyrhizobium algeriense]|uniref:SAM-dependent methyltransferase n=1 Tax=Bradyrhizobium algeriense TaxID=634784 RepID=A0ABU8BGM0_9BRAD
MEKSAFYRAARWAYQPVKQAKSLAVNFNAWTARKAIIERYLKREGFTGLQIGSGSHKRDGWLNSDLPGSGAEIGIDITERLPFQDSSLHSIYGCEVIEHIPKHAVLPFFKEAFRVLRPRGVFRLTTPDLEEICRIILGISNECTIEQISTIWLEDKRLTRDIWANAMFRSWGHQYVWDFESLREIALSAGFSALERKPPQVTGSSFLELKNLETRYGMPPPPFVWATSIIAEAVKP